MFRRHYKSIICGLLWSISSLASAYQKPGAPVYFDSQWQPLIKTTNSQIPLVFKAQGTATIEVSSTPANIVHTNLSEAVRLKASNSQLNIPITVNGSLDDVDYVNLFVTFIADNGDQTYRALSVKTATLATKQTQKSAVAVPSDQPIYMSAKESVNQ